MVTVQRLFKRPLQTLSVFLPLLVLGWNPALLRAQSPEGPFAATRVIDLDPQLAGRIPVAPPSPAIPLGYAGAGLVIVPTFDPTVDVATQAVINNAILFYEATISTPITVNIHFRNMSTGLGSSYFVYYTSSYSTFRAALGTAGSSPDDVAALANTPTGSTNPINLGANIGVKSANGRAIGLNTPEVNFGQFTGSPCPTFTGSGCIGINVSLANQIGDLTSVIEHEIDEILGLGSALNGTTTNGTPWPEDLFRWISSGVRSYAANPSSTNPCTGAKAFFSIDGGVTNLNEFNNCANGGDYGDWITHTPSQVQDAFTNGSGAPVLTATSSEIRALDVIGYRLASSSSLTLTSITPSVAGQGSILDVVLAGTGFVSGATTVSAGSGISVGAVNVVSPTLLVTRLTIDQAATTGTRNVTVSASGLTSNTQTFTIAGSGLCRFTLNQTSFTTGDSLTIQTLNITNPDTTPRAIEYKFWIDLPGGPPYSYMKGGADGSVILAQNYSNSNVLGAPQVLAAVTASFPPRGVYKINCRLVNPDTAQEISLDSVPFVVQ